MESPPPVSLATVPGERVVRRWRAIRDGPVRAAHLRLDRDLDACLGEFEYRERERVGTEVDGTPADLAEPSDSR